MTLLMSPPSLVHAALCSLILPHNAWIKKEYAQDQNKSVFRTEDDVPVLKDCSNLSFSEQHGNSGLCKTVACH